MGKSKSAEDHLGVPSSEDVARLNRVWLGLADNVENYMFSPKDRMEVWAMEHRVRSERLASQRLTRATWVLSGATVVLALSTIALVWVTLQHGAG